MPRSATTLRVLKAGDVDASPVAGLLPGDAAAQARREADAALATAVADAYERGMADGRAAAEHDGVAALPRLAQSIAAAVDATALAAAAQVSTDRSSLVAVAAEVAAWMVGEQAAVDPSILLSRLDLAMEGLQATAPIEVEVAPSQLEIVRDWAPAGSEVLTNPALGPGEAIVRAGAAGADLRLSEAVRRVIDATGEGHTDG